jgi:hypothetical protein
MYNRKGISGVIIENNDTIKGYGRKNIQARHQIQKKKTGKKIDFSLV